MTDRYRPTFRLQFHTSKRIDTASAMEGAASAVNTLCGKAPRYVCYLDGSGRSQAVPFDLRNVQKIVEDVTQSNDFGAAGACELKHSPQESAHVSVFNWVYPKQSTFPEFVERRGFPQNLVTFEVAADELERQDVANSLVRICGEFGSLVEANYGRGWCHEHETSRPLGRSGGLMSGLPNSYWLNVLGRPFVDLIGADVLDRLEHCHKYDGIRTVLASAMYDAKDLVQMERSREALRLAIGSQYFAQTESAAQARPGGSGLFGFVVSVLRERKQFGNEAGKADLTVKIPWDLFLPREEERR